MADRGSFLQGMSGDAATVLETMLSEESVPLETLCLSYNNFRERSMIRCVAQDSNSGHQLLLPPANRCPVFASSGRAQIRRGLSREHLPHRARPVVELGRHTTVRVCRVDSGVAP